MSSNSFNTHHKENSKPEVVHQWDDKEIAKTILALRERFIGIEKDKIHPPQEIFLKTDGSITMNTYMNDVTFLAFVTFQIENFKLTKLKISEHEVKLEKPAKIASDMIIANGKKHTKKIWKRFVMM